MKDVVEVVTIGGRDVRSGRETGLAITTRAHGRREQDSAPSTRANNLLGLQTSVNYQPKFKEMFPGMR